MPEFPRYESKGQLTTQAQSAPAVESTQGQRTEALGKVAGQVQDTAFKWIDAVDTIQSTTAEANFKTGMADILARAENDPEYNNSDLYFKEIDQLKKQNLKGFASKRAEGNMALQFDYQAKVAQIQVDNLYKKKMIDVGRAETLKLIDLEVNNPTEDSLKNVQALLKKQVDARIYSAEDAYKLERKANDDLGVNKINKDLYQAQSPEEIDLISQGITMGAYEQGGVTIEPDKKKALLDIADRAKANLDKKLEAQAIEAKAKNRVDTIAGIATGQIDLNSIDLTDIGEYDTELSKALEGAKDFLKDYNPALSKEELTFSGTGLVDQGKYKELASYADSVKEVFLKLDNQSLGDYIVRQLNDASKGNQTNIRVAALAELASLRYAVNNPQSAEDNEKASRFKNIQNAVNLLQASNSYLSKFTIPQFVVRNFFSKNATPESVMEEAKSVLRDQFIERYNSLAKLDTMPNKIIDGFAPVEDLYSGLDDGTETK